MIPLGLSASDQAAFHNALRDDQKINVRVQILTLDHTPVADVSDVLIDGQVDLDRFADVTRSASLSLADPTGSLPFDSDSPANGALYMDRMIRVIYSVYVDALARWVDVPVFTGPVTKLDRQNDVVEVVAQGKEILTLGAAWHPMTLPKGMRNTTAIFLILSERGGEDHFDLGELDHKMATAYTIGREDKPWRKAWTLAQAMNRQLFYDGAGVVRLRRLPGVSHFDFNDQAVTSPPQISFDTTDAYNVVNVVGGISPTTKKRVHYTARAPQNHPLNAYRLGRNGKGRFLVKFITNEQLRWTNDCQAIAERELNDALLQAVTVSYDSVPVPHLEPGDLPNVATGDGAVTFRLNQFSLPLVMADGNAMSVGALKNVRARKYRRVNRR